MTVPKLPGKSYIYMVFGTLCAAMHFVNIFIVVRRTGETPFCGFSRREWRLFFVFRS